MYVIAHGLAYTNAIEPCDVIIVNIGKIEFEILACPCSWNVDGLAEPQMTVEIAQSGHVNQIWQRHGLPCSIVVGRICIDGIALCVDRAFTLCLALEPSVILVLILLIALSVCLLAEHDVLYPILELRNLDELLRTDPCLDSRTAPAGHDETHWYVQIIIEILSKEIACSREVFDSLW